MLVRYALSIGVMALLVALKHATDIWIGRPTPLLLSFLPLLLVAWFAGFGPGVVCTLFIVVAAQYVALSPSLSLAVNPQAPSRMGIFVAEMTAICWLTSWRRTAAKKVAEAERLYRLLADNIPQLVWTTSADGKVAYINQRYVEFSGLDRKQLLASHPRQLLHPDDVERAKNLWSEALRSHQPLELQNRIRRSDGVYRWFLVRGVPLRNADGEIIRWVGTCTDIDDEKREEEARARLAAIVNSSNDAVIAYSLDGRISNWNQAAAEIYGYAEREIIGEHVAIIIPSDRQAEWKDLYGRTLRGDRVCRFETERVRKDGQRIQISLTLSPIKDASGQISGMSAIGRDITNRKRAEGALRESEERFRTVADAAPVMIWMSDAQGNCVFCNKTYTTFTGRPMDLELTSGWLDLVHPSDDEFCRQTRRSSLDVRKPYEVEYRMRRADGQFRWVTESAVPRFGADGIFVGFIGSCVDITERKWIEQSLRGAFDELEVEVTKKDHALAEASKQLRTETAKRVAVEEALRRFGQSE